MVEPPTPAAAALIAMQPEPLKVEYWPIERLLPYAANARTHSEAQVAQLAESMGEFGFTAPCLVDAQGELIAGHGRLLGAKRLGMVEVPVIVLGHLTEAQIRAYRIADNQIGLNSDWDVKTLLAELERIREDGIDPRLLGFDDQSMEALLASINGGGGGLTDPDAVPEAPAVPVTRPGDVWLLGPHRLLCGDATSKTDVALCLGAVRPHLMVTDPPYGVAYDPKWRAYADVNKNRGKLGAVANDDRADWREAWELFPGDVAYCWHAGKHASEVQVSLEAAGLEVRSQIIWAKDRFALSRGDYHWQHEPCWYAVRKGAGGHWLGDRSQTTLWQIPAREDSGHGHGTQKPVECMKRPIANNSSPGQAVYDPFVGSGTTIIAAEMTGRACHAIEIDPVYVDVALLRWQAFSGKAATTEDGRTFADVAGERAVAVPVVEEKKKPRRKPARGEMVTSFV